MAVEHFILAIIGATATGKSDLAFTIAKHIGAELLSVDSMQVYRGMDIGTAKPTLAERSQVRHHLVDVCLPSESFTVARFVELADRAIADTRGRGVPMIATGGTPLYFKSLFQGLFAGPGADPELRQRLGQLSPEELSARVAAVDPAAAARFHRNDSRRLIRALEVFELTGKPISDWQTQWEESPARHPVIWFGLNWPREELTRRINARVKAMLSAGWIEETRQLLAEFGALSSTASEAAGYAELLDYLAGKMDLETATEHIKIATRQLSRRQTKWFRRFPDVTWLDGTSGTDRLAEELLSHLQKQRAEHTA
ncbi:MAG TPA: tRNA (adenosine(37)-N6)-dimethylallyltransferase MiaA [Tepidisphaeraceae bacterium]|jgi:tRNA dimethylallyltransferase|nr:tRNA (adenosine(37)-N6)-dimethylallyltransferase MiaA [Tepidisphaeraceae bacterium]